MTLLFTAGVLIAALVFMQLMSLSGGTIIENLRQGSKLVESFSKQSQRINSRIADINCRSNSTPAWKGWKQLRVASITYASQDCKTFVFVDPDGAPMPSFIPGQFLMVGITQDGKDPSPARCYSLSHAPSPSTLQITVKRVPNGVVSNWLHDNVSIGDLIGARAPGGRFVLDINRDDLVVGIAAGVGITPMSSMAHYVAKMQPERPVVVFLSARDADHCPMVDELRQLERTHANFTLVVLLSRPNQDDAFDLKGRISIDTISRVIGKPIGSYYLCGPMEFMTSLSDALIKWGVPEDSVSFESFGGEKPSATESKTTSETFAVQLRKSGKKFQFKPSDTSLLEAAESAGANIEADCRAGACGTCLKKILKGKVSYEQSPSYGPIQDDECLACVAMPAEDVELDA